MYRKLVLLAACLTFGIIVLGAYVRLTDAGLGCPDWPGCYGHLSAPDEAHEIARAEQAFPGKPVESRKAWVEMIHRYVASTLGLLILAIAAIAWKRRGQLPTTPALPLAMVGLVVLQGMLGMWTVTLLLKPAIVTAHLLGGMILLALLTWHALAQSEPARPAGLAIGRGARGLAAGALAVLAMQIALGGWVSTNYAALACLDLPTCQGRWFPPMDFANAFHVVRELGMTAQGELLSSEAMTAIHWTHRLGALVVALAVAALAVALLRARLPGLGCALLVLLGVQIALGLANVAFSLPLPVAVAHNGGAALLLVALVTVNQRLARWAARPVAVTASAPAPFSRAAQVAHHES